MGKPVMRRNAMTAAEDATGVGHVETRASHGSLWALLPFPCLSVEMDGTIRRANEAAAVLLRAGPDGPEGRDLRTYVAGEERSAFASFLEDERARGGGGSIETNLFVGSRGSLLVRFDARVAQDSSVLLLFARELERERSLERALVRSEKRSLDLSWAARERVMALDEEDRITYVNAALASDLDRTPGELLGRPLSDIALPTDGAAVEIPRTGGLRELRLRGAGGELRLRLLFTPIADRSGRYLGIVATDSSDHLFAEERLRDSRHSLRLLYEAAPVGIFRADAAGDYLFVNGRWASLAGLSPQQATGRGWLSAVHPDDRDYVAAQWRSCAERGRSFRLQYRMGNVAGPSVWVLGQALPELDEEGRLVGFVGTIADIGELKRAEEELLLQGAKIEDIVRERTFALEEARKRTALILDSLEEGVCEVNPRGRIDFANPASARLLGIRAEVLLGTHFHSIIRHNGPGGSPCPPGACPLCDAQHLGESRGESEAVFIRADGSQFVSELVSSPILEEGRLIGTVVVFRDVTRRRQDAQARIASELRYKSLFDNLPIPVFVTDLSAVEERCAALRARGADDIGVFFGDHPEEADACMDAIKIVEVNQASVPFFGAADKEDVPRCFVVLFDQESRRAFASELARLADGVRSFSGELLLRGGEGAGRQLVFWLSSDMGQKAPLSRVLVSFIDVTEAREAEREAKRQQRLLFQSEKMASLGILVAGMAHEINNPNHTIRLNASLFSRIWESVRPILDGALAGNEDTLIGGLEYGELRTELPLLLRSMLDAAEHIDSIVRGLKDFSRAEEDEAREEVSVNLVVTAAVTLLQNFIDRSTSSFRLELAPVQPRVLASFHRLEQVLVNLIQNACQALERPSQAVVVGSSYDRHSNRVRLVVRDEGRGMTADELRHMRDPFFTTKRSEGGLGLGVPISASIVEDFGGSLDFESAPGHGTSAVIELPASAPGEAAP